MENGSNTPHPTGRIPNADIGEVRNTTETRQGVTGQNVRTVLVVGTIAIIVLFVIIYFDDVSASLEFTSYAGGVSPPFTMST